MASSTIRSLAPRGPRSVVLFREPTLWSQYGYYIVATGILLVMQSLLIGGLLVQGARRRRVENELRESEERFRLMADKAPVMVWRSNVEQETDFFNLPWLEFRGRTAAQEARARRRCGAVVDERVRARTWQGSIVRGRAPQDSP